MSPRQWRGRRYRTGLTHYLALTNFGQTKSIQVSDFNIFATQQLSKMVLLKPFRFRSTPFLLLLFLSDQPYPADDSLDLANSPNSPN